VCTVPCTSEAACTFDAGSYPMGCQATAVLVSRGFDAVPLTPDDKLLSRRLCTGLPCVDDAQCRPDGGVGVCTPQADPAQPLSAVVLRCAAPAVGALHGGDTCSLDSQCQSGVCGTLQPPSVGTGRACFEACTGGTTCPGTTSCRAGGLRLSIPTGSVLVDSCAP
jgi:hypothetical protein